MTAARSVVLVGGGHAHIEVIRRFGVDPVRDVRMTVVDPNPRPVYSGMVPGFVAGQYAQHELEIDLGALCDRSSVDFVEAAAVSVDDESAKIELAGGDSIAYDVASLDVGSTVAGADLPGVREYALSSRPIATLVCEVDRLLAEAEFAVTDGRRLHVVGAGAGGVELALCADARLRTRGSSLGITLLTSDPVVLATSGRLLRARVERALGRRGIETRPNSLVTAVQKDAIELADGSSLASSGVLWVTGAAAHPLAANSGIPTDARAFIRIRPTLQVEGRPKLFAVGDCASLAGMKKAGVYAVRSGPLLDHNLRAALRGLELRDYAPQRDFLSLLNLGNGSAIGAKWGVAFEGRSMMWLKDRIDRSFMQRYQP